MGEMYIITTEVAGILPALDGMRNPKDSWDRGDSCQVYSPVYREMEYKIGEADMKLAKKLIKGGTEHRKFLRQIQVWANVNIPRYMWSEFDTYKFGTKNSCSTMHTIDKRDLTLDDFYLGEDTYTFLPTKDIMEAVIKMLNFYRGRYQDTKDYSWVIQMKRLLPESFLQLRTWNTNYEEIRNMYHQRKHHRLKEEWVDCFCVWVESLPYANELILDK